MQEITVETAGNFMLLDILGGQEISEDGPTTVKKTHFVELALEDGRLVEVETKAKGKPKAEDKPDAAPTSGRQAAAS